MRKRPDHYYTQSGVLPYRMGRKALRVLLITTSGGGRWVIPKGVVGPGLTPVASAKKEAREEAGVKGRVPAKPLGSYRHAKWGGTCTVKVYPMRVSRLFDTWDEDYRRREWVSVDEASLRLRDPGLHRLLRRLQKVVGRDD